MGDANQRLRKLRETAENINVTLIDDLSPFFGSNGLVFRRLPDSDELGNVTNTCSNLMCMATSNQLVDFFKVVLPPSDDDEVRNRITKIFEYAVQAPWIGRPNRFLVVDRFLDSQCQSCLS